MAGKSLLAVSGDAAGDFLEACDCVVNFAIDLDAKWCKFLDD